MKPVLLAVLAGVALTLTGCVVSPDRDGRRHGYYSEQPDRRDFDRDDRDRRDFGWPDRYRRDYDREDRGRRVWRE